MKESNIKVLYHANCLDGFASAMIVKHYYETIGLHIDCIPVNYNQEPPEGLEDCDVYIVDFSYPRLVLVELLTKVNKLIVLDHHKTAQEDLKDLPFCYFNIGKSGCEMAWEYFYNTTPPDFILDIADRDLWRFKRRYTKQICASLYLDMREEIFFDLLDDFIQGCNELYIHLITKGEALLEAHEKEVDNCLRWKTTVSFWNLEREPIEIPAVNCNPKYSSDVGNRLAKENPDSIGCTFHYDGGLKKWKISLRSIGDVDVSSIAKFYDGGGHKNAAGFLLDSSPVV